MCPAWQNHEERRSAFPWICCKRCLCLGVGALCHGHPPTLCHILFGTLRIEEAAQLGEYLPLSNPLPWYIGIHLTLRSKSQRFDLCLWTVSSHLSLQFQSAQLLLNEQVLLVQCTLLQLSWVHFGRLSLNWVRAFLLHKLMRTQSSQLYFLQQQTHLELLAEAQEPPQWCPVFAQFRSRTFLPH